MPQFYYDMDETEIFIPIEAEISESNRSYICCINIIMIIIIIVIMILLYNRLVQ